VSHAALLVHEDLEVHFAVEFQAFGEPVTFDRLALGALGKEDLGVVGARSPGFITGGMVLVVVVVGGTVVVVVVGIVVEVVVVELVVVVVGGSVLVVDVVVTVGTKGAMEAGDGGFRENVVVVVEVLVVDVSPPRGTESWPLPGAQREQ
jgi:hypothetical protein